jgi:PIN domain nuclease of toxin-antitoxin system
LILLDTHIWVWWVSGDARITPRLKQILDDHQAAGYAVSLISCWEVAKLVEVGRLKLDRPVSQWITSALAHPGVQLVELTPQIMVESTQLPGSFHRDRADQLIVATARVLGCELLTADQRLLQYAGVKTLV